VDGSRPNAPSTSNPTLGLRAVRLCLKEQSLFRPQVRAILRVSAEAPVRMMIPMIATTQELAQVMNILDDCKRELASEGKVFDDKMPVGGMVEVPAAAVCADIFARHLDFLSIGTNDLIQYALAADRVDEQVAHLYDPQHPGVVQLLLHIFRTTRQLEIPLSVCGELAGDRRYTRLLLALGLREFSMNPRNLLEVKQVIVETDIAKAKAALLAWLESGGEAAGTALIHDLDRSQRR